jgi:hypothetical protein
MHQLFDAGDSEHHAGLSYIRVSLAASDLSSERMCPSACRVKYFLKWIKDYSYNDVSGDAAMEHFTLNKAANTVQVLKDIAGINKRVQLHLVPWSPVRTSRVDLIRIGLILTFSLHG